MADGSFLMPLLVGAELDAGAGVLDGVGVAALAWAAAAAAASALA